MEESVTIGTIVTPLPHPIYSDWQPVSISGYRDGLSVRVDGRGGGIGEGVDIIQISYEGPITG